MQMVVGFDFSRSNEWTGNKSYGRSLHDLSFENPYMKACRLLSYVVSKFDDDNIYPAYRFGCIST